MKVEAITANDARWIQTVSVTPNTQYVLSGYIKTVNVAHTSQSQDAGANLSILGGYTSTPALFGTNGWKYVSVVFNSGSNTQVTVAARLGMYSGVTTGTAWFDDLQLEPVCYTLTKAANPSGGGSVSASPAPNCNGGTQYTINTVVTLTANANSGYSFSSWSGNASGAANPTTVTMNANKSVTANFAVSLPNLKPHKYPDWDYPLVPSSVSGTHAVNTLYAGDPTTRPTYLDWAVINDGSASTNRSYYVDVYFDGTLVKYWEITDNTTPGMSWYLHDWVLSVTTTPGPHTLRLVVDPTNLVQETNENDNTWSMTFNWINPSVPCYTLTKGVSPSGRGSVSANPAPNCNGGTQYTEGTLVTLTATPNGSYVFTSWTGDASGAANPTTVTMNGNKSVTANFAEPCYTLTKSVNPSAGGSVTANPAPNCNGGTQYLPGTQVTLWATVNGNYTFTGWGGDASGAANPTTVTMNGNKSVTANFFAPPCYTLTTNANPSVGGSVSANPAPNCNGGTQYLPGTQVTLWAMVNGSYIFGGWSGDASGAANPTTVTMNANKSVTANFTIPCYALTTNASPSGSGSVSANPAPNCNGGTMYTFGTVVTLWANSNGGNAFNYWSGDASGAANPTTVTMNGNKSVTANFAQPCYTLTKGANPSAGGSVSADTHPELQWRHAVHARHGGDADGEPQQHLQPLERRC